MNPSNNGMVSCPVARLAGRSVKRGRTVQAPVADRSFPVPPRRAFSAVEVIISVVILAFALLPVINMMSSGRKSAALTEYHVLAQLRARRILEAFSSYPYEALLEHPQASGGGLRLPFDDDGAFPPEYKKKLNRYDEMCFFEELEPGLGLMTVKISWTLNAGARREYLLQRLFYDEGLTLTDKYPLRQRGTRFVK